MTSPRSRPPIRPLERASLLAHLAVVADGEGPREQAADDEEGGRAHAAAVHHVHDQGVVGERDRGARRDPRRRGRPLQVEGDPRFRFGRLVDSRRCGEV